MPINLPEAVVPNNRIALIAVRLVAASRGKIAPISHKSGGFAGDLCGCQAIVSGNEMASRDAIGRTWIGTERQSCRGDACDATNDSIKQILSDPR